MSILGRIFSGSSDESKEKKPNLKKVKRKRLVHHKKIVKKEIKKPVEKKESSLVFNSDNDVEDYYKQQRERARDLLKQIEKQKATSLIHVANKQLDQVRTEKHNLAVLQDDIISHMRRIFGKSKELHLAKTNNKSNIEFVKKLKKSMIKLEREALGIILIRKALLDKEKKLVDRMNKIAQNSESKLNWSDKESSKKIIEIEQYKEKLIQEAKTLLTEEDSKMFNDTKTLDSIGRIARFKIKRLNNELKRLNREVIEVLKKKQLLELSEKKVDYKLKEAEKKINNIKSKYKRVLGYKE